MVSVKNAEDKIRTFVEKDDFIKLKVELEKEIIRLKVDVNEIKSQIQRMKDKKNEKNSKSTNKAVTYQTITERFKALQKKLENAATATTTREDSKIAKGKEKKKAKRNKMRKKKKKNENSKNNE